MLLVFKLSKLNDLPLGIQIISIFGFHLADNLGGKRKHNGGYGSGGASEGVKLMPCFLG